MDEKKLWVKISGSINYYLRYYDRKKSDEELLEDYLYCTLEGENGKYEYLDKQTFEFIELNDAILEKAINAFKERLKKKRDKNFNKNKEIKTKKSEVIDFNRYKKL